MNKTMIDYSQDLMSYIPMFKFNQLEQGIKLNSNKVLHDEQDQVYCDICDCDPCDCH